MGDLKSIVLHDMKITHVKSNFPLSLGARISGVDDCTYSATGESFSTIVLPQAESTREKILQADDVALGKPLACACVPAETPADTCPPRLWAWWQPRASCSPCPMHDTLLACTDRLLAWPSQPTNSRKNFLATRAPTFPRRVSMVRTRNLTHTHTLTRRSPVYLLCAQRSRSAASCSWPRCAPPTLTLPVRHRSVTLSLTLSFSRLQDHPIVSAVRSAKYNPRTFCALPVPLHPRHVVGVSVLLTHLVSFPFP